MAITYTWHFGPIKGRNRDGLAGVAEVVHWKVTAEDSESGLSDIGRGMTNLLPPDPDNFTALGNADQATRRTWVLAAEPNLITETEALLEASLSELAERQSANGFRID